MSYRWQNRHEPPSHADDWLMTYADTITLLLCFFVVFLIVSIAKKDPPHQNTDIVTVTTAAAPIIAPALPDPNNLPFHKLEDADFVAADQSTVTAPPKPDPVPEAPLIVKAETPPPLVTSDPPPPPPPMADKSDRITVLEMDSATFFDSGSAVLNSSGDAILKDIAIKLKADPYKDYLVTVEGHTDDTPIHTTEFPSNWELSTARASAVVHFFLDQGVPAQRLRAAGYADTFPKAPNRDSVGNPIPTNQAQNRRVVIKLEKVDKAPL